jgi:hypothetical protein
VCCSAVQVAVDGLGDGQLESLSHVFLHCPVVQPAVAWSRLCGDGWWRGGCRRWTRGCCLLVATPFGTLAGARLVQPELWTHLRLLFCRAVWHLRCCRAAEGYVFTAAMHGCGACDTLRQNPIGCSVLSDCLQWLHVTSDLACMTLHAWESASLLI